MLNRFEERYRMLNPAQKLAVDTLDGPVLVGWTRLRQDRAIDASDSQYFEVGGYLPRQYFMFDLHRGGGR